MLDFHSFFRLWVYIFLGLGVPISITGFLTHPPRESIAGEKTWETLEPGLELGEFPAPQKADSGDSIIRILKIDPQYFDFCLLMASAFEDGKPLTARQWAKKYNLVAAINASMYQKDYRRSVSLMKTRTHTNNARISPDKTILAFDPLTPDLPKVTIIDRECDDFSYLSRQYGTLIQSIRMISCQRKNVWTPQPKKWSTSAIGMDFKGNILFIHVTSPYSTYDLINNLLKLPIGIQRAMYTEGGAEAQLFFQSGNQEFELVGVYETSPREITNKIPATPIPNIIGIRRLTE